MDAFNNEHVSARQTSLGWTPLHCAIGTENLVLTQQLVTRGANVNSYDNFNRTPLSIAASKGNLKLIQCLIENGGKINDGFPLHYACEKGHHDTVRYLIQNGADCNLEKDGSLPLMIAVIKSHLEVLEILTKHGADVRAVIGRKPTALHLACEVGNVEVIAFLIASGCDVNAKDEGNATPLFVFIYSMLEQLDIVKLLLEKGALTDLPDDMTANSMLHYSLYAETTLDLIKHGADVNARNMYNKTPLYKNAIYNTDCAKILLQHDANPNIAADGGWTPLHAAAYEGDDMEFIEELIRRKADVNAASAQNIIPLHLAARQGHLEVVSKLLQHGSLIDVPVIDVSALKKPLPSFVQFDYISEGSTPCSLALANKHYEVVKLLTNRLAELSSIINEDRDCKYVPCSGMFIKCMILGPCSKQIDWVRRNNLGEIRNLPRNDVALGTTDLIGWSLLHHSVSKGFHEITSELIKKGVSVNAQDRFERTPLSVGAARNDLQIVKLLLDNDADVNLGLAIQFATEIDSIDCMTELIKHNCLLDSKSKNAHEPTALMKAASKGKAPTIKILLENAADLNCTNMFGQTALHRSCKFGHIESVRLLLKHGANIDASWYRSTPLADACYFNRLDIVKLLLEHNAELEVTDGLGWTVLHWAAYLNHEDIALELIKAGASIDPYSNANVTPLYLGAANITILKALIQKNATINICAHGGWTPLHRSAAKGALECVRELLEHGVNVNGASAQNVLPIYLASVAGHVEIVKELFSRGSYIDEPILDVGVIISSHVRDGYQPESLYEIVDGNTPLIGAAANGRLEVVKLLHSYGASVEATNGQGQTALHEAALHGFARIVKFLVALNVKLDVTNKAQKTALDLAKEMSRESIVRIITSKMGSIE